MKEQGFDTNIESDAIAHHLLAILPQSSFSQPSGKYFPSVFS